MYRGITVLKYASKNGHIYDINKREILGYFRCLTRKIGNNKIRNFCCCIGSFLVGELYAMI